MTKVWVGGLDERTEKRDLEDFFRDYRPASIWVARKPPGFAFVEFDDIRDAEDAVRGLDGRELLRRRIRVEVSDGGRGKREKARDEKCFECGEYGHFARECRNRRRRSPGRSRSPRRGSRSPPRRRSPSPRRGSRSPPRRRSPSPRRRSQSPPRGHSPAPQSPSHNGNSGNDVPPSSEQAGSPSHS